MDGDFIEDWEQFPDDWYDGADDMMRRAYVILLENCYSKKEAQRNTDQSTN